MWRDRPHVRGASTNCRLGADLAAQRSDLVRGARREGLCNRAVFLAIDGVMHGRIPTEVAPVAESPVASLRTPIIVPTIRRSDHSAAEHSGSRRGLSATISEEPALELKVRTGSFDRNQALR
jgi:hypothetical protein